MLPFTIHQRSGLTIDNRQTVDIAPQVSFYADWMAGTSLEAGASGELQTELKN